MVSVRVYGKTPPEEFDQVAQRAYDYIDSHGLMEYVHGADTKTQLINALDETYFKGNGVPELLTHVGHSFERKGFWKPKEIKIAFPEIPEGILIPEEAPKEVKIEITKYKKVKKAKKVRPRIAPEAYSEEFVVNYVNSRPSRAKKGQIYKVTKGRRLIKRTTYIKRMKNLAKGWYRKRKNRGS